MHPQRQTTKPVTTPHKRSKPAVRRTGPVVTVRKTNFGRILVDGRGRALYLFTHDPEGGKSRCYGACATAWPPYVGRGLPEARGKVLQGKLATVVRSDGKDQVTYAGHPLYYYVGDHRPGQVLCQAATEYGGTWYVVKRDGSPVL
jgi:predicted lipoprotein with Yx(FWY)xxD motif